jgi:hypothetical protein
MAGFPRVSHSGGGIDGIHEADLANFIAKNPTSALASLAKTGVHYTKAYVNNLDGTAQNPSDSFPACSPSPRAPPRRPTAAGTTSRMRVTSTPTARAR